MFLCLVKDLKYGLNFCGIIDKMIMKLNYYAKINYKDSFPKK